MRKPHQKASVGICVAVVASILVLTACKPEQNDVAMKQSGVSQEIHAGDRLTSFSQEITSSAGKITTKAEKDFTVDIKVKNTGTQPWFGGKGQAMTVDASYRWVDEGGNVLPVEGNRVQLTKPVVGPNESDSLQLRVTAPTTPGSYSLWLSMVQEGVAWFYLQGAKALSVQVIVN